MAIPMGYFNFSSWEFQQGTMKNALTKSLVKFNIIKNVLNISYFGS